MTVGDAILSLVDKLLAEREKVVRLELSKKTTIKRGKAIRQRPTVYTHKVDRVGFTACSIFCKKKYVHSQVHIRLQVWPLESNTFICN